MPHNIRKLILDILLCCEEIRAFVSGKNYESFLKDRVLQLAIERQFEIIGEAFNRRMSGRFE